MSRSVAPAPLNSGRRKACPKPLFPVVGSETVALGPLCRSQSNRYDQWLYAVVACYEYAECKSHTDPAEPNKRLKNDAKFKWDAFLHGQ